MSNKKSIRDFNYNHSDIFLAAIILIIAAGLIFWRIEVIMAYPTTIDASSYANNVQSAETSGDTTTSSNATKTTTTGTLKATWEGDTLAEDITVEIKSGKSKDVIQSLVNAGLFVSSDDFDKTCQAAKRKASNAKAGTYTFTKGMTKTDVAKAVTK